jgi:nucleotide-binding universal stress UspA family protein
MITINRVLCPVDFSPFSRHALAHAVALARWYGANVTVLHVFQIPTAVDPAVGPILPVVSREELMADLEGFVAPWANSKVRLDLAVEEGLPGRDIVMHARRIHADLIVLGTHGVGGFEHFLVGSVTEKVLRKAPCPVLTVPPSVALPHEPVGFKRILCPVDFEHSSMQALAFALSLAEEADAQLTVLHVLEPVTQEALAVAFDEAESRRLLEQQSRQRMAAAIPAEAREWCQISETVAWGKPYREILRVARETGTDLIVMGVAGRGPVNLMVFGSTTNHVVRQASCPVLTQRLPSDAATGTTAQKQEVVPAS